MAPRSACFRRLTFATAVVGVLAFPAAVHAFDMGSSRLDTASIGGLPCTTASSSCIQIQDAIDGDQTGNIVPSGGGIVTRFRIREASNDIALTVLRQTESGLSQVAGTADVYGSGEDEIQSFTTHVVVEAGDYVGLKLGPGASIGVLEGGEGTNAFELSDAPQPQLIDAAERYELLFDVRVEPDQDGDGKGDETEEPGVRETDEPDARPGPLAALRAGAKPGARIVGKRFKVSKRRIVRIKIANPNAYKLRGKLRLAAKGLKLGTKSFSVRGKGRKTVTIKLPRKGFRALGRRRALNAVARATVRGPIGKSGTVKKSVRIKAPPKPKPKPQRRKGGGGGTGGTGPKWECRREFESGGYEYDPVTGRQEWRPGGWKLRCGP